MPNRLNRIVVLVALLWWPAPGALPEGLQSELDRVRAGQQASRDVQYQIDRLAGARSGPATTLEERRLAEQIRALERAVDAEREAIDELAQRIRSLQESEAGLVPLLDTMLATLERVIDADLPFDVTARKAAVARTRADLSRHDLTLADRYTRVLSAWLSEIRLGYTTESATRQLMVNGQSRVVDVVRVGRLALYYVTADGAECGLWLPARAGFSTLQASDCRHLVAAVDSGEHANLLTLLPLPGEAP